MVRYTLLGHIENGFPFLKTFTRKLVTINHQKLWIMVFRDQKYNALLLMYRRVCNMLCIYYVLNEIPCPKKGGKYKFKLWSLVWWFWSIKMNIQRPVTRYILFHEIALEISTLSKTALLNEMCARQCWVFGVIWKRRDYLRGVEWFLSKNTSEPIQHFLPIT
jgi:hypothetical protein